jgi:PTS system mannose-specific IIA component
VGDVDALEAVSLDWDDDVERARQTISEAVARLDKGDGVLIVTDMFGGTPSNICLSLLEPGKVEIVSGANLPMLIKFANLRERLSAAEIAGRIAAQGRQAIQVASEVLDPSGGPDDAASEKDA